MESEELMHSLAMGATTTGSDLAGGKMVEEKLQAPANGKVPAGAIV